MVILKATYLYNHWAWHLDAAMWMGAAMSSSRATEKERDWANQMTKSLDPMRRLRLVAPSDACLAQLEEPKMAILRSPRSTDNLALHLDAAM
mmetsp:Transcript_33319/g.99192  ORF Transcript_33319/g.99192 Transcript_33319/m.99192 type:complete len:92 (-) Transcript_33319:40-315(-)